mgnify:FL=1
MDKYVPLREAWSNLHGTREFDLVDRLGSNNLCTDLERLYPQPTHQMVLGLKQIV